MSVARCREINARLRAAGITVHEYPGCWTRGNGQSPAYEGGLVHHTAGSFGSALRGTGMGRLLTEGRPDLSGPLCNWAGNEDGSLTFIAAFPANHAGASGGRSMGPLPVTRLFNPRVFGLEIVYPGDVPMRTAQWRAAHAWARIVTDVCGYSNIERARAHAETSITGKWDPGYASGKTIDMAAFRHAAATSLATSPAKQEDDMPSLKELLDTKLGADGNTAFDAWKDKPGTWGHWFRGQRQLVAGTRQLVSAQNAAIDKLADLLAAGDNDLTPDGVKAAVKAGVAEALAEGTVNVDIDITAPEGH